MLRWEAIILSSIFHFQKAEIIHVNYFQSIYNFRNRKLLWGYLEMRHWFTHNQQIVGNNHQTRCLSYFFLHRFSHVQCFVWGPQAPLIGQIFPQWWSIVKLLLSLFVRLQSESMRNSSDCNMETWYFALQKCRNVCMNNYHFYLILSYYSSKICPFIYL